MQLHPPGAHRVRIATGMLAAVMSLLLTGCGSTGGSSQSNTNTRCGTTAAHPCAPGQSGGIAGTVWNWGTQHNGPIGNGVYSATKMSEVKYIAIAAATGVPLVGGDAGSYALATKGFVESWGHDGLDTGNLEKDVIAIAGGGAAGYALKSDGTVWAWGSNRVGNLGDGTKNDSTVPVQVSGLSGVTAIAAGFALKSDGTVREWGGGQFQDSLVPVQVQNLSGVTAIAGDGDTGFALKPDGTVWAWGSNTWGQLGDGTTNDSSVPVQVKGLAGVTAIAIGAQQGFALSSK